MSHAGTKLKYLCGIIEQFQKPKHSLAALCYMPASVLTQVIPICILTKMLSADWTPPCRWWLPLSCPGMCIAYHFDYLADQHIFFEKSSHWAGLVLTQQSKVPECPDRSLLSFKNVVSFTAANETRRGTLRHVKWLQWSTERREEPFIDILWECYLMTTTKTIGQSMGAVGSCTEMGWQQKLSMNASEIDTLPCLSDAWLTNVPFSSKSQWDFLCWQTPQLREPLRCKKFKVQ